MIIHDPMYYRRLLEAIEMGDDDEADDGTELRYLHSAAAFRNLQTSHRESKWFSHLNMGGYPRFIEAIMPVHGIWFEHMHHHITLKRVFSGILIEEPNPEGYVSIEWSTGDDERMASDPDREEEHDQMVESMHGDESILDMVAKILDEHDIPSIDLRWDELRHQSWGTFNMLCPAAAKFWIEVVHAARRRKLPWA